MIGILHRWRADSPRYQKIVVEHEDKESNICQDGGISHPRVRIHRSLASAVIILGVLFGVYIIARLDSADGEGRILLAKTVNGTYAAQLNEKYNQYQFLGMPYALPPVETLRFRPAQPSNVLMARHSHCERLWTYVHCIRSKRSLLLSLLSSLLHS